MVARRQRKSERSKWSVVVKGREDEVEVFDFIQVNSNSKFIAGGIKMEKEIVCIDRMWKERTKDVGMGVIEE